VIDGRPISSGDVTDIACLSATIQDHAEMLPLFVTKLQYPVVLGIPWLAMHDVSVRFGSYTLQFDSKYCKNHCNLGKSPLPVPALITPTVPTSPVVIDQANVTTTPLSRAGAAMPGTPLKINLIGAGAFAYLTNKHKLQAHAISVRDVNLAINSLRTKEEWKSLIPNEYHEFIELFSEKAAEKLPPHRPYDHSIPLLEGKSPPYGPLYGMSREELEALKKYLEENLTKSFIRHSSSPAGAPVLFVKKADSSLQLCVDY
jgi:hypothetical protein